MRPAPGIHVEWVDDEAVALDTGTDRLHYLNPPAALVYALILEHGYEEALRRLRPTTQGDDSGDRELAELLDRMVDLGLLVDGK